MAKSGNGSMALFILGLLAVDAAVVAGFDARDISPRSAPAIGASEPQVALDWALCQTLFEGRAVTPTSVAITYLDEGADRSLTADEVRAWFGDLDPSAVQVSRLEHRSGRRRIALELWRDRWGEWDRMAGSATGREVCGRMRAALIARGIERPRIDDSAERSRHDFEFIYERRSKLYRSVSWVGTLDDLLQPEALAQAQTWLNEVPAAL